VQISNLENVRTIHNDVLCGVPSEDFVERSADPETDPKLEGRSTRCMRQVQQNKVHLRHHSILL